MTTKLLAELLLIASTSNQWRAEKNFSGTELISRTAGTTNFIENQRCFPRIPCGFSCLCISCAFFSVEIFCPPKKMIFTRLTKKVERLEYTLAHVFRHDQSSNAKPNSS
jgi:hypothetical protein